MKIVNVYTSCTIPDAVIFLKQPRWCTPTGLDSWCLRSETNATKFWFQSEQVTGTELALGKDLSVQKVNVIALVRLVPVNICYLLLIFLFPIQLLQVSLLHSVLGTAKFWYQYHSVHDICKISNGLFFFILSPSFTELWYLQIFMMSINTEMLFSFVVIIFTSIYYIRLKMWSWNVFCLPVLDSYLLLHAFFQVF